MSKKLIFLVFLCLFFAGCGASDSAAPEVYSDEIMTADAQRLPGMENSALMGTVPAQAAPEDAEDRWEANGSLAGGEAPAETETVAGSNFFTFIRANSVTTAEDGTELLYEYSCDTTFTSWDRETEEWVDGILEQIHQDYASNSENLLQYAQDHLTNVGAEYFYSFSNYQEVGVARHDTRVVSLMVLSSVYSGGAHPNAVQTTWNLDLEEKKLLRLEDVIHPDMVEVLAEMVKQRIDDKFVALGENALFSDYGDTISRSFFGEPMTPYWYFNDQGLVIFYNQYELGPYAAGIIKTQIDYPELEGILREDYFPGNYTQIPGDMLLRGDWDGYRRIPITVESDGERMLIGVEGEVYQIQLSEVSWLEGTVIGQKMLFSADRMTQNDVLELIGGYDDETRSYAVEFSDGQGNVTVYYIHPDRLSTEPQEGE